MNQRTMTILYPTPSMAPYKFMALPIITMSTPPSLLHPPFKPATHPPSSHILHPPKPTNLPNHHARLRNRKIVRPLHNPPLHLLLPQQLLRINPQLFRYNNRILGPYEEEYSIRTPAETGVSALAGCYGREADGGYEAVDEACVVGELP